MGQLQADKIDFTKYGLRIESCLSPRKETYGKQTIKHKRNVQEI